MDEYTFIQKASDWLQSLEDMAMNGPAKMYQTIGVVIGSALISIAKDIRILRQTLETKDE